MMTILVSFVLILFLFAAMAVGVLCGRSSIRGTCGRLNGVKGLEGSCQPVRVCVNGKTSAQRVPRVPLSPGSSLAA
jgi:hypothetical protein